MKLIAVKLITVFILLMSPTGSRLSAADGVKTPLRILTEPAGRGRTYDKHGNLYGMSTDLIKAIQQQVGNNTEIEVLPWARAYAIAVSSDNVAVYDTIRTTDREEKFKWVGPIKLYSVNLYAPRGVVSANVSLAELLDKHIVCETRNTSIVSELLALGFVIDKNLILSLKSGDCYNMLKLGRADLIAMHDDVTPKRQAELVAAGLDLVPVYPLQDIEIYLAFSKAVNDELVAKWQCALNTLVQKGHFRQMYQDEYPEPMITAIEHRLASSQQLCH